MNFDLSRVRAPYKKIVPVHKSNVLESDVIKTLPAAHVFTCCDSSSKVATKSSALIIVMDSGYEFFNLLTANIPII